MTETIFAVGDRVTYADINLRSYTGTVTSTEDARSRRFLTVQWDGRDYSGVEWAPNLLRLPTVSA